MLNVPNSLIKLIQDSNSFLLLAHQKPDGDAVGSVTALGRALKTLGKEVDYFMDPVIEEKLRFIPETESFLNDPSLLKPAYDAVLYLDTSTKNFAYAPDPMPSYKGDGLIDHHKSNTGYTDADFVYITGATSELVFELIRALGVDLDDEIRKSIFTALTTDTGSFQFGNTTSHTHETAAAIHEGGHNFASVSRHLHTEKSYEQLQLLAEAIKSLKLYDSEKIAIFSIPYDEIERYGGSANITDDVSNIGMNIPSVKISAFLKEVEPDVYKISLRSKSSTKADVSSIALSYGGGGHKNAAGFSFDGTKEKLLSSLLPKLTEELRRIGE